MFDIERWQEIFDTIRKNKLRTFLTGLSVASGIFILVILLGFGQGMQNGIENEFQQDAATSIWVFANRTTKPYKGLNPGRNIQLRTEDYVLAPNQVQVPIDRASTFYFIRGVEAVYGNEVLQYELAGTLPDMQFIENESMVEGRFLNQKDVDEMAKVLVIGRNIKKQAFGDVEDVIGQYIQLSGIPFKIIGVYTDPAGEREENRMFIPLPTAQVVFNGADYIDNLTYVLPVKDNIDDAVAQSVAFKKQLTTYLKQRHTVAPDDENAINVWSPIEEAKRFYTLTSNIKLFFWIVGICTIIAGVVGVSNIMLIVVKERTKEIGIRKALGAKPRSIIGMILHEAIFVTAISGFMGLITSMALLEVFGPYIEVDYILNPSVNFNVALTTVFVLVFAGAFAGFFPAWRAAKIHTIDALRDE